MSADASSYVYRTRNAWTGRQPGDTSQTPSPRVLFVHISESNAGQIRNERDAAEALRSIDAFHRTRGWAGIGYSFALVQAKRPWRKPRVFECRGFGRVPASQQGCNAGNASIVVLGTTRDLIRGSTKRALVEFFRRSPCTQIKGHRECEAVGGNTDCPGSKLMSVVRDIRAKVRK